MLIEILNLKYPGIHKLNYVSLFGGLSGPEEQFEVRSINYHRMGKSKLKTIL